jgi:hypothetical protein
MFGLSVFLLFCYGCQVKWLGHPVVNLDSEYTKQGFLNGVEIGLREDGVVVWRFKEKEAGK